MYRVTIQLVHGCKVEFAETTILRAAARVENYREHMVSCDIQQIEEEGDNGGSKVDQTGNWVAG